MRWALDGLVVRWRERLTRGADVLRPTFGEDVLLFRIVYCTPRHPRP